MSILLTVAYESYADDPGAPRGGPLYDNGTFITGDDGFFCDFFSGHPTGTSFPVGQNITLGSQSKYLLRRPIDDFTVPPGESWTLTSLFWRCYQPGTLYDAQIPDARVRIWSTPPVAGGTPLWGDMTTNRAINTTFTEVLRTASNSNVSCTRAIKNVEVILTGLPPLPPGTYWIEIGFDSTLGSGLFSPPTEPRLPGDNALQTDFSEIVTNAIDEGSGLALEYPFQLFGTAGPEAPRACVLPNGTCTNATLLDCHEVFNGAYNYFYTCSQLGACCNHATGVCVSNTGPMDCTAPGKQFSAGVTCAAVLNCGLINGACCFPNDVPSDCQAFTRGINCSNMGGKWHAGNCSSVTCNDYCETPTDIFDGDTPVDNFGNGTERSTTPNQCNSNPFIGTKDVWFRYTSTLTSPGGVVSFSMCQNSTYHSTLQAYLVDGDTTCDDLNGTAAAAFCDVEGCGISGGPAMLTVPANPGDVFLLRLGGYNGAEGSGILRISTIEADFGACCKLDGTCEMSNQSACLSGLNSFTPLVTCVEANQLCGPIGACCRGTDGCNVTFENLCDSLGGTYLGVGSECAELDCDGDGETNLCAFALGAMDCNLNEIPDSCDIGISGNSTDCDANGVPDECQPVILCCRGDANGDSRIDARDIDAFVDAMIDNPPPCQTKPFCRMDMNDDFQLDMADVAGFAVALIDGATCPMILHSSARLDAPEPGGSPFTRKVFMFDETGSLMGSYDAVPEAQNDAFGYRDGATDGTYVYFGWTTGVARHDADGANGVQIIAGATPGTGATWRALAFDPTGDGGNGSFWSQSFTADLIETTLTGQLLNQFPNDLNLYGLAYDHASGMLWGHSIDETNTAIVVEMNPETGLPTGNSFPSHFNVPGISNTGLAFHGGLEMDPVTHVLFGALQGNNDALFSATTAGSLIGPLSPNPRIDITEQTGSIAHLGVTMSRP